MSFLEIIAAVLGVACVWLTARQHIACWPTGLAMVTLYVFVFYEAKLYSDMLLQVVYIGLQIYGWHAWVRGGPDRGTLRVTRVPRGELVVWFAVVVVGTVGLGSVMFRHTDASFPFVDAFTTVASLVAQWLMGRKRLESWLVWLVVDVVSVGLYFTKALYVTAGLYAVFLGLATAGWFSWRRSLRSPVPPETASASA